MGKEFKVETLEDLCDLMCDNQVPEQKETKEFKSFYKEVKGNEGGTVLDPFNGSGSTGKAVMYENRDRDADYSYVGIELTDEYLPIADARIAVVANQRHRKRLI